MKRLKQSIVVVAAILAMTAVAPVLVSAQNETAQTVREQAQERRENSQVKAEQGPENSQTTAQERRNEAPQRLKDAKLKACQNREKVIKNIMLRIANRGEKQIGLFTAIADRTKAFYADKKLTLSNYDALVAEVDAKKTAAQATVDTIKNASTTFACDGDNPKGVADHFKESLKAEIKALKEYRTAVKNLIVGVKSAQNGDQ